MKKTYPLFLALLALGFATASVAATVEFTIKPGTGEKPWNTKQDVVTVFVGDILHIVNNDSVVHAIHTSGTPLAHTPRIAPNGGTYDAKIVAPYDPFTKGPLWDHYNASTGHIWLLSKE